MGTPNFASPSNASKYYVVLTGREETLKECDECNAKHYEWEDDLKDIQFCKECESDELTEKTEYVYPEDYEWDDFISNMGYVIKEIGGTAENEVLDYGSYGVKSLGYLSEEKYFGDINVEVRLVAVLQSAYYEGATLDYLIKIYNGSEMVEITNGHHPVDVSDVLDDLFEVDYESYHSDMNKGMRKIQKGYAESWVDEQISRLSEKLEKVFQEWSEYKLQCKGIFSNGEAIYTKVD